MSKTIVQFFSGLLLTASLYGCPECGGTCGEAQKVFKNQINKPTHSCSGTPRALPNEADRNRPKERATFVATLTLVLDEMNQQHRDISKTRDVVNNHNLKEELEKLLKHLQRGPLDRVWHSAKEIFKVKDIQKQLDAFMYRNDEDALKEVTTQLDEIKGMLEKDIEEMAPATQD